MVVMVFQKTAHCLPKLAAKNSNCLTELLIDSMYSVEGGEESEGDLS